MGAEALQFLLLWMAGWINRRQLEVIDYLKEEDRAFASSWAGGGWRFIERRERLGGLLNFYFRYAA
jgi:hypothetical protein